MIDYHHTIYWVAPSGTRGIWPATEKDSNVALDAFVKRFVNLKPIAMEPWRDRVAAGRPSVGAEIMDRVVFLLDKDKPKAVDPDATIAAPSKQLTEAEIDACLGLPIKPQAGPKEPDNILRVRPFPNAWGRPV